jgi:hypothetical protein
MGRAARARRPEFQPVLKLDLGCGPHKKEGFTGVDVYPFDGVDQVVDLTKTPWPWKDGSVIEAHASHFLEHLTAWQRVAFCNELDRVLHPGGTCQIIVPHWASCRAYGDPTHVWPPVSEFWFYYLNRDWRKQNAPHTDIAVRKDGFSCHLEATWGYSMHDSLLVRSDEYRTQALQFYKEAAQDLLATLKKV